MAPNSSYTNLLYCVNLDTLEIQHIKSDLDFLYKVINNCADCSAL